MIQNILDKLWKGPKVNNKLDGYWYVRLADVSRALQDEMSEKDLRKEDQEYSQDNWNKGVERLGPNPHSITDKGETNDE